MKFSELEQIVLRGEDSTQQFKADMTNEISMAQEMVAFANSGGGCLFIGIGDNGTISGLQSPDIARLNQLVSNTASQQIRPAINPRTENIVTDDGLVMKVEIFDGVNKPYMDKNGVIWVKSGADKRKATAREEIQRLYQKAGLLHGDEVPVRNMGIDDLDKDAFRDFFEKNFSESLEQQETSIAQLLTNMNLMNENELNVSGVLLFAKSPEYKLPVFIVKAVAFPGNDFHETSYLDSRDITGKLESVFQQSKSFVLANIRHIQKNQGVNSIGIPEIPAVTLEELIANALIHRDYFVSAPIRLFVFDDRVEIISPGHLPNNLTIENIKRGNSNIRNPILASFATKILPYRGLGSGISRALKAYPDIDFEDDRDGNLFKVTIRRIENE